MELEYLRLVVRQPAAGRQPLAPNSPSRSPRPAPRDRSEPIVDRFGQWVKVDFPTKVKSDAELKDDAAQENAVAGIAQAARHRSLRRPAGLRQEVRPEEDGLFPRGPDRQGRRRLGGRPGHARRQRLLPARHVRHQPMRRLHDGPRTRVDLRMASQQRTGSSFRPAARATRASSRSTWPTRSASTASLTSSTAHFGRWIDRLRAWGFNSAGAFNAIPAVVQREAVPLRDVRPRTGPETGGPGRRSGTPLRRTSKPSSTRPTPRRWLPGPTTRC